jgi:Mor family transcriptional regulator
MSDSDIVSDILRRVVATVPPRIAAQLGLQLTEIEVQVRRDWGGERHYIPRRRDDPAAQQYISTRNAQIRREHHQGERIPLLARRHGLTERHVRRILGEDS